MVALNTNDAFVCRWCVCVQVVRLCAGGAFVCRWCVCVRVVRLARYVYGAAVSAC